jgi:putative phosphonate metabolism protein
MQEQQARYAIYFVAAPESDLHRFGSAVLGYDCYTGDALAFPHEVAKDHDAWHSLTEEPRRYGFHATLKAPFRLAPPRSEGEIVGAFRDFAAQSHPIARFAPQVRLLGAFVAVVPRDRGAALVDLANRCTTVFDCFRAPTSAEERGRRIAAGLSERQVKNLDRWGYPYVFDDFRFHMTLTGSLPPERRDAALGMLRRSFGARCGDGPIAVDRLGLVKQKDAQGRFSVLCAEPLRDGSQTSSRQTPPFSVGR